MRISDWSSDVCSSDLGQHDVGRGDEAAGVEHPWVVDERTARVEVLAAEDTVAAQPALGEKRVRPSEGRGGVLVAGEAQPPGRAQRCRAWFPSLGDQYRRLPFVDQSIGVGFTRRLLLRPVPGQPTTCRVLA